jgi:hypothetical protein
MGFYAKKSFGKMNFRCNICNAMNKSIKNIQWWWHSNSTGVL